MRRTHVEDVFELPVFELGGDAAHEQAVLFLCRNPSSPSIVPVASAAELLLLLLW